MFGVAAIGMLFQQMLECMHVGANVAKLLVVGVGVGGGRWCGRESWEWKLGANAGKLLVACCGSEGWA